MESAASSCSCSRSCSGPGSWKAVRLSATLALRYRHAIHRTPDPDRALKDFVEFVVQDTQTEWQRQFRTLGRSYERTVLVLFEGGVSTGGCGSASAGAGPFYCPADRKVYLELGFFRELDQRFGAPGDFAQAYVIAHEFGHHVQNLLDAPRGRDNDTSVRFELQADCYAGVWGASAERRGLLDVGDLDEALAAAASVGDDRIQRGSGRTVDPESFTHGTSEQRRTWFRRGFTSGDPNACDTFSFSVPTI